MNKILKMGASWCAPCRQMEVQLTRLGDQLITVIEHVDIENAPQLAQKYNIRSVPTLVKLNAAGEEIGRLTGSLTDAKLLDFAL